MNETPIASRESVPQIPMELLPCPFDRGCAEFLTSYSQEGPGWWVPKGRSVACKVCKVSSPEFKTETEASKWWNRRASSWIPLSERLPEVCKPVLGYAERWVDSEYNEMGMRECFRNDDYWQSAAWNNYQDCWDVEHGSPDYWSHFPDSPSVPSLTEALTASGVSASPDSPSSPSPLVSVEEWKWYYSGEGLYRYKPGGSHVFVETCDSKNAAKNIADQVNASLASLTAEIERLRQEAGYQEKRANELMLDHDSLDRILSEASCKLADAGYPSAIDNGSAGGQPITLDEQIGDALTEVRCLKSQAASLTSRLEEAEETVAKTVKEFNQAWLVLFGARTDYPATLVTLVEQAQAIINERDSLRASLAVAERDRENREKLTELKMRNAWEAGIKLARSYHDNICHLEGEQKETQWRKFKSDSGITDAP